MAMTWWDKLEEEVIKQGLCTRCGSCVGLCPTDNLVFFDKLAECIPVERHKILGDTNGISKCIDCKLCYDSCPGKYLSFPQVNDFLFEKQPHSQLLGNYIGLFIGHSSNDSLRQKAASGGIVTALLLHLLKEKKIDGAVVLGMNECKPWETEVKIARTNKELLAAAQSKYVTSPINVILKRIGDEEGRFAFVGLPCQIESLRKIQMQGDSVVNKIEYMIGLYCGNTLHFAATQSLLRKLGINDLTEIRSLEYRSGKWPGNFRVVLQNGNVLSIPKFHFNYLIPLYIMRRCLLCIDFTNEFADISVGDGWLRELKDPRGGWSVIISRTEKGKNLLKELERKNEIALVTISETEIVNMHSHAFDFKKKGAFVRISFKKKLGKAVPEYGVGFPKINFGRMALEYCMILQFKIGALDITRKTINVVPIRMIGKMFEWLRQRWMKKTRTELDL